MFPSTHDLFEISPFKEACMTVLGRLLESDNEVLVTTKPRLIVIQEIIERFGDFKEKMQFRFTITSDDDRLLKFWEPNAPNYEERLSSLKLAFQKKFKTSISVEPFLDYDPTRLFKTITPFVTESIWMGKMNYIARNGISRKEERPYNRIRKNYERRHLLEICSQLCKNSKIRFKDSVRSQLDLDCL